MQLDPAEDILLPLESLLDALQLCLDAVQDALDAGRGVCPQHVLHSPRICVSVEGAVLGLRGETSLGSAGSPEEVSQEVL